MNSKPFYVVTALAALLGIGLAARETHDGGVPREVAQQHDSGAHGEPQPRRAHFGELAPSDETRSLADWVARTGDNGTVPFIVIDKRSASIFVFDADGRARATAPVLLGAARGDRFGPGVAEKDMYETSVAERITPAGRFVAEAGVNDQGHDVVWIQYDSGIAMHAVLDSPGQRRRERLSTATPEDNRISYGCVNLPTDFYRDVVRPIFDYVRAVVYVLPDGATPPGPLAAN